MKDEIHRHRVALQKNIVSKNQITKTAREIQDKRVL